MFYEWREYVKSVLAPRNIPSATVLTLGNKLVLFSKIGVFSGTQLSKVEEEELIQSYQTIYQALKRRTSEGLIYQHNRWLHNNS